MSVSHSTSEHWGKLYRLSFWRFGVTLDWGSHRIIWTISDREPPFDYDEPFMVPAALVQGEKK